MHTVGSVPHEKFYTPFFEMPGYKAKLAKDSLSYLDSIVRSLSNTFWEDRAQEFVFVNCCSIGKRVCISRGDQDYQRGINGFFEDMWFLSNGAFSPENRKILQKTMVLFNDLFPSVVDKYKALCSANYGIPLFFTIMVRWIQGAPHSLEGKRVVVALQNLREVIFLADEPEIDQQLILLASEINSFAHRAMNYVKRK